MGWIESLSNRLLLSAAVSVTSESLAPSTPTDSIAATSPAAPRDLAAVQRSFGVRIIFTDASTDEEEFVVERAIGSAPYSFTARIPGSPAGVAGERVFFEDSASIGYVLAYRVRAVNPAGTSEPTNEVRLTLGDGGPMGFAAEYFNDRFFNGPPVYHSGTQPAEWWSPDGSPDPRVDPGTFSAVYEAIIRPEFDETYTFHTASADGIALIVIDAKTGEALVDYDNLAAERQWHYLDDFQDVAGSAALVKNHPYFVRIRYSENAGEAGYKVGWSSRSTPLETLPYVVIWPPVSPAGPKVGSVYASGSGWSDAFVQRLSQLNLGYTSGYRVSSGATQLAPLPWTNVDRVTIGFDRQVRIDREDLTASGVAAGDYAVADFNPGARTWSLSGPFGADRVRLSINADKATGGVVGIPDGGQALDGEWVDGVSYWSGDGREGGDFRFALNVLPGDVDRNSVVNALDLTEVKRRLNSTTAANVGAGYSVFADVNADGRINALDLSAVRQRLNTRLPNEPPIPLPPTAVTAPSPVSATRVFFALHDAGALQLLVEPAEK